MGRELRMSHCNARQARARLKKRQDLDRLCPECFQPRLTGPGCLSCGFSKDEDTVLPAESAIDSHSVVYSIQPLGGLGSVTDYDALRPAYGGRNIAHLVEKPTDPLLERCKSELWQQLKEVMPPDSVVEEATRLLTKEVREFKTRFPALAHSTKAKQQLVDNVLKLLAVRYPTLVSKRDTVTFRGGAR
jgi:hypothetical protein